MQICAMCPPRQFCAYQASFVHVAAKKSPASLIPLFAKIPESLLPTASQQLNASGYH
jgi:hypothetical protein